MAEMLLEWLNRDISLSKQITNIADDFSNGYFFAEILYKMKIIPRLSIYKNTQNSNDISRNFCLLAKNLLDMKIYMSPKNVNEIRNKSKYTANIILCRIKQYLDSKYITRETLRLQSKSSEIANIYKKYIYANDNEKLLRNYIIKRNDGNDSNKSENKTLDRYMKLKEKFKHLKLSDDDLRIIQESMKDMEIYDEIKDEIYTQEKARKEKVKNDDIEQMRNNQIANDKIKQRKEAIMRENMRKLIEYRDSTLNYFSQSCNLSMDMIKRFNENLSSLGLDVEPLRKSEQKEQVSTEIIMMRMKEKMQQKMFAKKEKEKRARKILKEQIMLKSEESKKEENKSNTNIRENQRYGPIEINEDENNKSPSMISKVHFVDNYYKIHDNENIKVANRISLFKTVIPIEKNNDNNNEPPKEESKCEYYSRSLPFDKEKYLKSIECENVEYNIRMSQSKQEKKQKHYKLIEPIANAIIDIVDEVFIYQTESKVDLICEEKWKELTNLLIANEPIKKEIVDTIETDNDKEDEDIYNEDTFEYTQKEDDDLFVYCNYIDIWKRELIHNDLLGKRFAFSDLYEGIFKSEENLNTHIKDYEPTEAEIENLIMPDHNVLNVQFGDIIENSIKHTIDINNSNNNSQNEINTKGKFWYLPIKIGIVGYPLSGKKTQAKMICETYPKIKLYDVNAIFNDKVNQYNELQKPIEDDPKFKTFKQKQIDQWNEEHQKKVEAFMLIQNILQPYLDIKAEMNETEKRHIKDKVMFELLIYQMNIDFPIEEKENFINELKEKYLKSKELKDKIDALTKEEIETKKSKAKEIQTFQKEIDKLLPDLYSGFILIDFPSNDAQSSLLEQYFTGYISETDKPKDDKDKKLFSYSNMIDISLKHDNITHLYQSGLDLVINLSLSSDELNRRFNGIRYDPVTNVIYHIEDNPPNQTDKKLNERLVNNIPGLSQEEFNVKKYNYDANIGRLIRFYRCMGDSQYNHLTYNEIEIKDKVKKEDIFTNIKDNLITKVFDIFYEHKLNQMNNNNINTMIQSSRVIEPIEENKNEDNNNINNNEVINSNQNIISSSVPITARKTLNFNTLNHNYNAIYSIWDSFASEYTQSIKTFLCFLSKQRQHIIKHLSSIQRKFIKFLQRDSYKKTLASIYVAKYNDLSSTHPNMRNQPIVIEELTNDINDLSEKIWLLIQEKKNEDVKELERINSESIIQREINALSTFIEKVYITEAKKYLTSIMVIKEYYMKNANESNTLSLVDIDSLFSEAKNETLTFADKNNLLFTKSMQVIILQDANIKEYVTVFKMSNNYNNIANKTNNNNILSESSITSSRIHKKKTFANSSISNDFAFYEEEIKNQISLEKSKFKYRLITLKTFAQNANEIISNIFTEVYSQMDEWIIKSVKTQNDTLNSFIYYIQRALHNFTSAISLDDFEFDSYDIYKPINIERYFSPENDEYNFNYNIRDLLSIYNNIKQYATFDSSLIKREIIIEILIKKYFANQIHSDGISSYIKSHSYSSYRKFIDFFIEDIQRIDNKENVEYDKYVNINNMFTALILLGSKTISANEFKNMIDGIELFKSTKVNKENFMKIYFWFEEDDYLNNPFDEDEKTYLNERKINKVDLIKEVLFDVNKDEDGGVDIVKFGKFMKNINGDVEITEVSCEEEKKVKSVEKKCFYEILF